jgi:dipeptidyl aminopeptidase/acylaminoacyl peptidase
MTSTLNRATQIIISFFIFPLTIVLAQQDGTIVEQNAYRFPDYERAAETTDVEGENDRLSYETAVNDTRFEFLKLKYLSDGLKVVAYLYKPTKTSDRKLPAIIFNRPSAIRNDIAAEVIPLLHRFGQADFVVVVPMLRQSDGSEGRDEIGGADVNDLMNVVPLIRSLSYVDMDNLFMYGESRGGMMTYQAIKRGFPMRAASVVGAFTDLQELVDSHPKQYPPTMLNQLWANYESRKKEIAEIRSAIYWPDKLSLPLLIMHGGKDWSVNPDHSLRLAQQLQKLGRPYELIIYAEDNHSLTKNHVDRDRRTIDWFKRYLKQ